MGERAALNQQFLVAGVMNSLISVSMSVGGERDVTATHFDYVLIALLTLVSDAFSFLCDADVR